MAPLLEHEVPKTAISQLLEMLAVELDIPFDGFGSTTFKNAEAASGLEPDECYYSQNAARVRGMKRFDPAIDPPPDLAIEIDITSRSIPRQPIHAALGVPELWRFDGDRITILVLTEGEYRAVDRSVLFPFLPIDEFTQFVRRIPVEGHTAVLREFRNWVRTLPTP